MANFVHNLQDRVKTSTNAAALVTFKLLTGFFVGLTLALIGEQIVGYGWFSLTLVIVITMASLLRIARHWSWMHVLIFNLICVLIGLLLRMYILIAPG